MAAEYGLVNSNAEWKVHFDASILLLFLGTFSCIPQLFIKHNDSGSVMFIIIKIVDDLLAAGLGDELRSFAKHIGEIFTLVTISNDPGRLRFYGLNIMQYDYFTSSVHGDEKLQALSPYPL